MAAPSNKSQQETAKEDNKNELTEKERIALGFMANAPVHVMAHAELAANESVGSVATTDKDSKNFIRPFKKGPTWLINRESGVSHAYSPQLAAYYQTYYRAHEPVDLYPTPRVEKLDLALQELYDNPTIYKQGQGRIRDIIARGSFDDEDIEDIRNLTVSLHEEFSADDIARMKALIAQQEAKTSGTDNEA